MTGFGHGEHRDSRVQMVLEMRSYNNRFLELSINLPYSIKQLEPRVREYLSARIQRGKVEFYLSVTELEESSDVVVDHARVRTYMAALEELRRTAGIRERPALAASHRAGGGAEDRQPQGPRGALGPGGSRCWTGCSPSSTPRAPWREKKTEQDIAQMRGGHPDGARGHRGAGTGDGGESGRASASASGSSWAKGSTSRASSRKPPCSSCARTSTRKSSA